MSVLKGITIKLFEKVQIGTDPTNRPLYTEKPVDVENVLVGQPDSSEILDTLNLTGRKVVYILGIPKGDTHDWEDCTVEFWGQKYRVIGIPTQGIEEMIPLDWNRKVKVERFG